MTPKVILMVYSIINVQYDYKRDGTILVYVTSKFFAGFFTGFEKKSVNFLLRGVNGSGWRGVRCLLKPSSAFLINKIYRFFSKPATKIGKKFAGHVNWNSAKNFIFLLINKAEEGFRKLLTPSTKKFSISKVWFFTSFKIRIRIIDKYQFLK